MNSSVVVTPRTHWINGWFLRLFARPVIRFDGVDHTARWGQPYRVDAGAGAHRIAVGARYRGGTGALGLVESRVEIGAGQRLILEARNGFFNHQPFIVTPPRKPAVG